MLESQLKAFVYQQTARRKGYAIKVRVRFVPGAGPTRPDDSTRNVSYGSNNPNMTDYSHQRVYAPTPISSSQHPPPGYLIHDLALFAKVQSLRP